MLHRIVLPVLAVAACLARRRPGVRGDDRPGACLRLQLQSGDQFGARRHARDRRERADRQVRLPPDRYPRSATVSGRPHRGRARPERVPAIRLARRAGHAEPLPRLSHAQRHPPGGGGRAGEPRAAAQHGAERPVRCGAGLHGRAARHRDPRYPPAQRRSSSTSRCAPRTSASMSARTRAPTWRRRGRRSRSARAAVSLAEANLAISRATYRQIIGHDPASLRPASPMAG